MAAERTLADIIPGYTDLGFIGATVRRLDVIRTAEAWDISLLVDREDGAVRCAFRGVQWVQLGGTWSQGLLISEFFHRPVPETLRETLPSLITHRDLYTLTVRGGSHINLVADGIDVTAEAPS